MLLLLPAAGQPLVPPSLSPLELLSRDSLERLGERACARLDFLCAAVSVCI